jgi:hypothetical protein
MLVLAKTLNNNCSSMSRWAEVQLYKAKMERAKQWLRTLFSQIEERLFG